MCARCMEGIRRIGHPLCPTCGRPFQAGADDHQCGECAAENPLFDRLRSAAFYDGPMRDAILRYKFNGRTSLVKLLGDAAIEAFNTEFGDSEIDSIIPVPLHASRLRWRGFNQSLLLARHIADRKKLWVDAYSLQRTRPTVPQVRLTPKQRVENVKGAFAVSRKQFVDGRNILLVDDITTTGSTIHECSKALRKAGAAKIYALTVARAIE